MKLVEKHIFNKSSKRFKSLDEICFLSKNLYNASLYEIRKEFEISGKWIRYSNLEKKLRHEKQIDYISLPNNTSQQILMILDNNLKAFFKALKEFKKNKTKFTGCPKFPQFKHKSRGRNIVIFTSNQFKLKDKYIYFPKKSGLEPIKTKILNYKIQQVRIIPLNNQYNIEIVYNFNEKVKQLNDEYLSIDLGLNNLATCVSTKIDSFIINGKPIKSINQYYNKKLAKYKSKLPFFINKKGIKQQKNNSNKIVKLTNKRNNKINDYIHKSSKKIVDYCKENHIDNVVLGKNIGWKNEIKLGKKINQNFVQISFNIFESNLTYKLQKEGLNIKVREESYTSKCSSIDLESIQKQNIYLGKRTKRGLFKSNKNVLINADVNGSLNILRKEIGDNFMLNKILPNIGRVVSPTKLKFDFN